MVKNYECTVIFDPDLDESSLSSEITSISELVTQYGGTVINTSVPRKTDMGYRIKKKKQGTMVIVDCDLAAEKVKDLNNALNLKETILRFTIILRQVRELV